MSSNNYWLHKQLQAIQGLVVAAECVPLITVSHHGREYRIYTPTPNEYIITADIVDKVRELGGNVISYPTTWCRASSEAIGHGRTLGIEVIPHGRLFELMGR